MRRYGDIAPAHLVPVAVNPAAEVEDEDLEVVDDILRLIRDGGRFCLEPVGEGDGQGRRCPVRRRALGA